jgi:hypothetical protein
VGYEGGYWHGKQFLYNTTVNNVRSINVTNVYTRTVVNNTTVTRVSYNGGTGGVAARPGPAELSAAHEQHVAFTSEQRAHESMARSDESLRASVNGGHPRVAATARPASFTGHDVVAARGATAGAHAAAWAPSPPTAYAAHPAAGAPPAYHSPAAAPAGHPPQGGGHEPQQGHPEGGHEAQGRR